MMSSINNGNINTVSGAKFNVNSVKINDDTMNFDCAMPMTRSGSVK